MKCAIPYIEEGLRTNGVALLAAVQSSVKSSLQGRRPISSTTVLKASVPFLRPASRSVSKWFEVEHAVKLRVKIWWL